jgi:XTP/dITP diphosphohydrolase
MNIVVATRNATKLAEIRALFGDFIAMGSAVLSLDEAGIAGAAEEDPNGSLMGNALVKARYVRAHRRDVYIVSDDTGLYIKALNDEPGINAAIWGGKDMPWQKRTQHCLDAMKGITDRAAAFATIAVLIERDGKEHVFDGSVNGRILEAPACAPKDKMPYSPLFVPNGHTKCWAEMTDEEENRISHRGVAFRRLINYMRAG